MESHLSLSYYQVSVWANRPSGVWSLFNPLWHSSC